MPQPLTLALEEIKSLTKHENTDAVRMALHRAGIKSSGVTFSLGIGRTNWPPKKIYKANDVWRLFGDRIIKNAETDQAVKEKCLLFFRDQITGALHGAEANRVFHPEQN